LVRDARIWCIVSPRCCINGKLKGVSMIRSSGSGVRLLDRSPQGIEPTIYGRALLKCGTAVFDDLQQGVKEIEFLADPSAGELSIGCSEPRLTLRMSAHLRAGTVERAVRGHRELPAVRYVRSGGHGLKRQTSRSRRSSIRMIPADIQTLVSGSYGRSASVA
jgi:hypothetical protein